VVHDYAEARALQNCRNSQINTMELAIPLFYPMKKRVNYGKGNWYPGSAEKFEISLQICAFLCTAV